MTIRSIAKEQGIPSSTLRGHVYGTMLYKKRSRKSVLFKVEEKDLVQYLMKIQELGYLFKIVAKESGDFNSRKNNSI